MAESVGVVVAYLSEIDDFGRVKLFSNRVFPDAATAAADIDMKLKNAGLNRSFYHLQICNLVPADDASAEELHLASVREQLRGNAFGSAASDG